MFRASASRRAWESGQKPSELGNRKVPKWVRKTAVLWDTIEDNMREKYLTEVNNSKWKQRFVQMHLMASQKTTTNWADQRGDMEPDEPCFRQTPLGLPGFHMGDRIWPIAMLNSNVIFLSIYLEKLTLVIPPGAQLEHVAEEVKDQVLVPMAYWNPKTDVKPFTIPGLGITTPDDVVPYWIMSFVDGKEVVVPFPKDAATKYEVVQDLQEKLHEHDTVDRKTWLGAVANSPDKNTWVRVKKHGLDDFTINEHCPMRYM
eukprot:TRINITY_DN43711_c0_g1_i1.p1 TRINITY_DN43711_c0_g1~~TRINITY_DN43711_c0_g1_i1.p1  ORF type:complete len:258 (+),score=61.50 TRINITY_DN43711_c0_g1_i1:70-843(+)